jgi:hypothetical protein
LYGCIRATIDSCTGGRTELPSLTRRLLPSVPVLVTPLALLLLQLPPQCRRRNFQIG